MFSRYSPLVHFFCQSTIEISLYCSSHMSTGLQLHLQFRTKHVNQLAVSYPAVKWGKHEHNNPASRCGDVFHVLLSWFTGVCIPCVGGMGWSWSGGGLPERFGVPALGLHPSGYRLHSALPHRHSPLPIYTLPSSL